MDNEKTKVTTVLEYLEYMKKDVEWERVKEMYPLLTEYWNYLELELSILTNQVKKENYFRTVNECLKIDLKLILMRAVLLERPIDPLSEEEVLNSIEEDCHHFTHEIYGCRLYDNSPSIIFI